MSVSTDPNIKGGYAAAVCFGLRLCHGPLSEEDAGRILAGMMPGDWHNENEKRKRYFVERARSLLLLASRQAPIYDEEAEGGRVWRRCE